MKRNANKKINLDNRTRYNYALQAIYDGVDVTVDGDTFSYDTQQGVLTISNWISTEKFKPSFNNNFCNPFSERLAETYGEQ